MDDMTTTIRFRTPQAFAVYQSMIEGMWEVARDDFQIDDPESVATIHGYHVLWKALEALPVGNSDVEWTDLPRGGSRSVVLPSAALERAEAVLANCEDNSDRFYAEDDEETRERDIYLYAGDVVIRNDKDGERGIYQDPEVVGIGCSEAIEEAMDALETAHCVEGIPDEMLPMMKTLEAIVIQRGCETNAVWGEGEKSEAALEDQTWLTSLMDVVIYG
jgi:hypothetical protein